MATFSSPLDPPQGSHPERMGAGGAILDPADVEEGGTELDLIPAQVAQFDRSQPCRKAIRIMVASRCPCRFDLAATRASAAAERIIHGITTVLINDTAEEPPATVGRTRGWPRRSGLLATIADGLPEPLVSPGSGPSRPQLQRL
jgi:hypothetical protein